VHTGAAVVAFAAACVAMLQAASASRGRALRLLSAVCGIAVALIAATGGVLSLAGVATDLGGVLELVATSIAIAWLVVFGATTASEAMRAAAVPAGVDAAGRDRRTSTEASA
jgi:hypothetical protein